MSSFLRTASLASLLLATGCGARVGLPDDPSPGADAGHDTSASDASPQVDASPTCGKSGYLCDGDVLVQCAGGVVVAHCPPGTCNAAAGQCEPPQPGCTTDSQCAVGGFCTTGRCMNGACGAVPAKPGTPCPNGVCDGNGQCLASPTCSSNADCPASPCSVGACSGGTCISKPLPAGAACPGGTCDGNGKCSGAPVCQPGSCTSCPTGNDCAQCCVDGDPSSYMAFLQRIAELCVCQANAACEVACVGAGGSGGPQCQSPDPNQLFQSQPCIDCINANGSANGCISSAAQKCMGDGSCTGYVNCASNCPAN